MRGENRKPIVSCLKLPQFTIMNVIEGQAGLVIYSSLIFYCLTIDNILNIIVLIILAGVSVSLVLGNNGIIAKTKFAKENMQVAANKEQEGLANLEVVIEEGTKGGSTTSQISISDLKAGDYIKYNTGVTSVGEEGVITCRVLYEASSEYGLQIISDKNVGTDITLGGSNWDTGRASYNTAIETLNNKAEDYLNTTYATDARCVGSLPTIDSNGNFTEKDKGIEETVKLPPTMPEGEDSSTWWNDYTRPSGWDDDDTGCYDADTNYVTDEEQMKKTNINIWTTGEQYWLASRMVFCESMDVYFRVRYVGVSGELYENDFYICDLNITGNAECHTDTLGVRPCFSLKSDIKIIEGNGKEETTAYIIGK